MSIVKRWTTKPRGYFPQIPHPKSKPDDIVITDEVFFRTGYFLENNFPKISREEFNPYKIHFVDTDGVVNISLISYFEKNYPRFDVIEISVKDDKQFCNIIGLLKLPGDNN